MKTSLAIVAAALAAASLGSARAADVHSGQLLVASDNMQDPNFERTVVLVLHNDKSGTLGVMINRPTTLDAAKSFPELSYLSKDPGTVYFGGPVARTRLLLLMRNPPADLDKAAPIFKDVVVSADPDFLRGKQAAQGELRVYAGHAEWAPGQLDREISAGAWHVVAGNGALVFSAKPLKLWNQARLLESGHVVDRRGPDRGGFLSREAAAVLQPPEAAFGATGRSSSFAFRYNSAISPRLAIATALSRAARGSSSMSGISSLIK
jgi:putative transcriptional regulator